MIKNQSLYKEYKDLSKNQLNDEFMRFCVSGNLEGIKYILTSPELKEHANLHVYSDVGFANAYLNGYLDIVAYFIFELNIEKSKHIKRYLRKTPNEQVEKMFNLRELNQTLEKELNSNKTNQKKHKL